MYLVQNNERVLDFREDTGYIVTVTTLIALDWNLWMRPISDLGQFVKAECHRRRPIS